MTTKNFKNLALMLVAISLIGCSSNKILLPTMQSQGRFQTPAQQEVLSDAVRDAVSKINAASFIGKKVYIEIVGVLPHTDRDLLDYCADSVRSHLSKSGAQIVFPKVIEKVLAPPADDEIDYRVVVALESGGADNNKETTFLKFSATYNLLGKARIRVSAYPTKGGNGEITTVSGVAVRTYKKKVFWVFNGDTPYYETFRVFK